MESSSSGGGLALRRNSGGGGGGGSSGRGSFGGDADPFDIPAKGAPLERLRKWRVSSLLHARRHFVVGERLPVHSGVCVCLYWFGLIVVGFGAECSFFFCPLLWMRVFVTGALDCFVGRASHSRRRGFRVRFCFFLQGTSAECGVSV